MDGGKGWPGGSRVFIQMVVLVTNDGGAKEGW